MVNDERESIGVDAWLLSGMPGALCHATYLVGRLAPQYRLIVDVLLETQSHSLTRVARVELPRLLARHAADQVGDVATVVVGAGVGSVADVAGDVATVLVGVDWSRVADVSLPHAASEAKAAIAVTTRPDRITPAWVRPLHPRVDARRPR